MIDEVVKKCENCGWTYNYKHPGKVCGVCRKPMLKTVCPTCGKYVPVDERMPNGRAYCKDCFAAYNRRKVNKMLSRYDAEYTEWLEDIKKIPKPYKTITEEQWLKACRYFGGCATCSNDEISARGFFIPFREGGRYCDWNVIPLCERCATATKLTNAWRCLISKADKRRLIIDYLKPIMEEHINEARET